MMDSRLTDSDGAKPEWERLEGEPERAWNAFVLYRDMEPHKRSVDAVGALLNTKGKSRKRGATGRLMDWSSRWEWVRRVRAYDDHRANERRLEAERLDRIELEEASERRRQLRAEAWQDYLLFNRQIRAMLDRLASEPKWGPKEVRELALARDRLLALAREADYGLGRLQGAEGDTPPDDVAAELTAVLAKHALRRAGKA